MYPPLSSCSLFQVHFILEQPNHLLRFLHLGPNPVKVDGDHGREFFVLFERLELTAWQS